MPPVLSERQRIDLLYDYATTLKKNGVAWKAIHNYLLEHGANPDIAEQIVNTLRQSPTKAEVKSAERLHRSRKSTTGSAPFVQMITGAAGGVVGILMAAVSFQGTGSIRILLLVACGLILVGAAQFIRGLLGFAGSKG
jgi:hypothetical protein